MILLSSVDLENRILCIKQLDIFLIHFKKASNNINKFIAFLLWFIFYSLLSLLLLIANNQFLAKYILPMIIAAFTSASALYIVDRCFNVCKMKLNEVITDTTFSINAEEKINSWIDKYVKIKPQLSFSLIVSIVVTITIYLIDVNYSLPFETITPTFIVIFILLFHLAQGVYWAVLSPFIVKKLVNSNNKDIKIYYFDPFNTILYHSVEKIFSFFTLCINIIVTLCLIGFLSLKPDLKSSSILFIVFLIVLGYIISFYTSVMPKVWFSKLVEKQLLYIKNDMQSKAIEYTEKMQFTDKFEVISIDDINKLKIITELHKLMSESVPLPFSLENITKFVLDGLFPIIIAIIGIVDWNTILPNFPIK